MMRKFYLVLALIVVGLLTGACAGNTAPVASPTEASTTVPTSEPTLAPTELPEPTAVPTEVPIAEPTAVPTEVPLYVGLPADEVGALRDQCLQDHPELLCLPLPFQPDGEVRLQEVRTPLTTESYLVAEVPQGATILSVLAERLEAKGILNGGYVRWMGSDREVEGLQSVSLGWGPFGSFNSIWYGSEPIYVSYPAVKLFLLKGESWCGDEEMGSYGDHSLFEKEDVVFLRDSGPVSLGDPLAQIEADDLCLWIGSYELFSGSISVPGVGTLSGTVPVSRARLSDLLRDGNGSIVYLAETSPETSTDR